MNAYPKWLPPSLDANGFGGDLPKLIATAYAEFHRDFIVSIPQWKGRYVRCNREPMRDGMEAGFWHCITEGEIEERRTVCKLRCERVPWMLPLLKNHEHASVDYWEVFRRGEMRAHLWFEEHYLLVLASRRRGYHLVTTFVTNWTHSKDLKRRERDAWRAKNGL